LLRPYDPLAEAIVGLEIIVGVLAGIVAAIWLFTRIARRGGPPRV
jgi:hypothetical protein